jgi:hypothetical protein
MEIGEPKTPGTLCDTPACCGAPLPLYIKLQTTLTRKTGGGSLGTFNQNFSLSDTDEHFKENYFRMNIILERFN